MDFKGRPFGPMPNLMAMAEYVTKVHAICVKTGNLAQYSYRFAGGDKLVELGIVRDCTDTDDEQEFDVQDSIREILSECL